MNINDIKHLAVERIFLIPDASEGQLGYVWCDDPAPGEGMDPAEAVEYVRKDVHDAIIKRQAKAAQQGMDAAKAAAYTMEQNASRMYAQCSPEALESEREANAKLTALVAELERDRDMHKAAEEAQIALRQKMEQERDSLAALFVRLQDGATDLIHASSEEEAGDAMELIAECSEKEARSILARVIAESRIEGALAVRHLTQGDDWEDTELRAVIDDYVAGLRRQAEAPQ